MTTIKQVREDGFDKFYTTDITVDKCLLTVGNIYSWDSWELVVEPSAGNGSFLLKIPTNKKVGLDIAPEHPLIVKQNFFEYSTTILNTLVIGNPPFGKISSLAIKFFNHSAKFAKTIAFIIPKTFRRVSVQNRLDKHFHLIHDEELDSKPCCFYPPMQVKCCFQIWEKKEELRGCVSLSKVHNDWEFLPFGPNDDKGQPTPPNSADFAILAYGGKCGTIITEELHKLRPKSWHWIKVKIDKTILINRFKSLDYSESKNTARQNSIGRGEIVKLYSELYG